MKPGVRGRAWEILARFVQDRTKRTGPDQDLTEEDQAEEIQEAANEARRLLGDKGFMQLRLRGLEAIVEDFASWLELDPTHPNYQRDLMGIHLRAGPRFWELFWPEEVIHRETELRAKMKAKEEADGGRVREGRRQGRRQGHRPG